MSQQISPLRQRMIDDMTIRNMSPLTQKSYIRAVKNFSRFFQRSPDKLTFEHAREYQLHLASRGLGVQASNQIMCGLRFFYKTTLGMSGVSEHIPLGRRPDALPSVLAQDEVERFLKAVSDLEFRTAFVTIYATGLHVSEAVALTIKDIDSARMVIHIRSGKGRKDRYVMLSAQLLAILRAYWDCAHPKHFLFPGPEGVQGVCRSPAQNRMGGLCQTSVRRPVPSSRLSCPLHSSRRHRQRPARRTVCRQRQLSLEGLSSGWQQQGHDACSRRVHSPLLVAYPT
jgi:integrase